MIRSSRQLPSIALKTELSPYPRFVRSSRVRRYSTARYERNHQHTLVSGKHSRWTDKETCGRSTSHKRIQERIYNRTRLSFVRMWNLEIRSDIFRNINPKSTNRVKRENALRLQEERVKLFHAADIVLVHLDDFGFDPRQLDQNHFTSPTSNSSLFVTDDNGFFIIIQTRKKEN